MPPLRGADFKVVGLSESDVLTLNLDEEPQSSSPDFSVPLEHDCDRRATRGHRIRRIRRQSQCASCTPSSLSTNSSADALGDVHRRMWHSTREIGQAQSGGPDGLDRCWSENLADRGR